jgi:hypothetical protein
MRHLVELQPTRAELNERSEGAGVDPWHTFQRRGITARWRPRRALRRGGRRSLGPLPRLFEALITEAVVEPIVTVLGGHDPLQAMRAPGQDGRPFHADPAATPVIVLEGRAVAVRGSTERTWNLIGAEYPAEPPERGELIPSIGTESGPTEGAFFRRRWVVGDSSLDTETTAA